MSESTPSSEFSRLSQAQDVAAEIPLSVRKYDMAEAGMAAHAAKPFMDAAANAFDAYREGSYYWSDDVMQESGVLSSLVRVAEAKSREAIESGRVSELSRPEEIILEAVGALTEVERSLAKTDIDHINDAEIRNAVNVAFKRSRNATDAREKTKWLDMVRKLDHWSEYLHTSQHDEEQFQEFGTASSMRVEFLLGMAADTGEVRFFEHASMADVRKDMISLRKKSEMYNFLAELYPAVKDSGGHKPLSDDEVAAAKKQIDNLTVRSRSETETSAEARNPRYNLVDTVPEAKELIYRDPDYLSELIEESEAYVEFMKEKSDASNARAQIEVMKRDIPELRRAVVEWQKMSQELSFTQYIEGVNDGQIEATRQQWNYADAARNVLRNISWRESAMARRMARKYTDKAEVGDLNREFGARYFGID